MKPLPDNLSEATIKIRDETILLENTKIIDTGTIPPEGINPGLINDCFSIDEIKQNYFFGIDLVDGKGNPFPDGLLVSYINSAINYFEALLDITLSEKCIIDERHDYFRSDYENWGYIQLWKKPVQEVTKLHLMYGSLPSFVVPLDWIKLDKTGGKIQLFPSSGSVSSMIISSSGVIFGLYNRWDYAPQLWQVDYKAGMKCGDIPPLLMNLVYKKASIGIFQVWSDLVLTPGIAGSSLSIDGLSQSLSSTASAMYGAASARIQDYKNDIEDGLNILRQQYGAGLRVVVV